jgi:hypothetical protein
LRQFAPFSPPLRELAMDKIKKWHERTNYYADPQQCMAAMEAEIAELRAALSASTSQPMTRNVPIHLLKARDDGSMRLETTFGGYVEYDGVNEWTFPVSAKALQDFIKELMFQTKQACQSSYSSVSDAILALPLPEPIWVGIDTHEGVQFHPSVEQAKSFSYDGEFTPYYGARQMRDLLAAAASLAALAQAPVAQGWQPIETAPKDGTEVLLWLQPPYNSIEKARWFDLWGNWQIGEFPEDSDEYCGIGSALPTHWMPIPTPPVIAHSADKESGNG